MKTLCFAATALLSLCASARADWITLLPDYVQDLDAFDWPGVTPLAIAELKKGRCEAAWRILWTATKQGDRDANFVLAQMVLVRGGMIVPGNDLETATRNRINLAAYGLFSENKKYITRSPHILHYHLSALLDRSR